MMTTAMNIHFQTGSAALMAAAVVARLVVSSRWWRCPAA